MIDLKKDGDNGMLVKKKRLEVFNLSQEDFAEKFNVPVGTLRNWEQGVSQPPDYFIQLLKSAEAEIRHRYETPISKIHDEFDNEPDNERVALRREARRKINESPTQSKIFGMLREMVERDGILDNLQAISPHFNDTKPSDIAIIAQLVLLKDISTKLGHIENMIEKMK